MASVEPIVGVNLGGWLVLEPWMTPSLFRDTRVVDEYTYCASADDEALQKLHRFRDDFITEDDVAWLAEQGVRAMRVPVGYWLFGDQPPYPRTSNYLDALFLWAHKYKLKVLISLHGAPGSQNGEVHSGRQGSVRWFETANIDATLSVLERIAKRYGRNKSLLGISLLNEPAKSIPLSVLDDFNRRANMLLQPLCNDDVWLIFSDGFRPYRWRKRSAQMTLDYHHYQLFQSIDRWLPLWLQQQRTKWLLPIKLRLMSRGHRLIVCEWSLALQGKSSKQAQEQYGAAQMRALRHVDAWFYWSYKTEFGGPWSFRASVKDAIITTESETY